MTSHDDRRLAALKLYNHERIFMKYGFALDMEENELPCITKLPGKIMLRNEWREVVSLLTSDINCLKKKHLTGSKKYFVQTTTGVCSYATCRSRTGKDCSLLPKHIPDTTGGMEEMFAGGGKLFVSHNGRCSPGCRLAMPTLTTIMFDSTFQQKF